MVLANSLNAPIQASEVEWTEEIVVFGRYLVDTEPPTKAVELYLAASHNSTISVSRWADRIVPFCNSRFAILGLWVLLKQPAPC